MSRSVPASLRIAIVGGGPAGSFFALYALKYARESGRDVSVTLYEGRDFSRCGPPGCNMCAGIVPVSDLRQFRELGISLPPQLILSRVNAYTLHTSTGTLGATQPDAHAEIISVYRGAGPRHSQPLGLVSFDQLLLDEAVSRGATLRRTNVEVIRRGRPVEVVSDDRAEPYDLVALATGVNGRGLSLEGFDYRPPRTGMMCQTELHLGSEEVERRLGSSVHIFLPPDQIASYGILIPKGPYVTASLLNAPNQMRSLSRFLELEEVGSVLGSGARRVCGCLPRISIGPARNVADDGFVAVGDAGFTRLYKNGIGSALATSERAAWTAIHRGCRREDFATHYLPLCRAIDRDNQIGRLMFLQVPLLKRSRVMAMAHHRLASGDHQQIEVAQLHARILWGMFTGAYSYWDLFRMAVTPTLFFRLALALGRSFLEAGVRASAVRNLGDESPSQQNAKEARF